MWMGVSKLAKIPIMAMLTYCMPRWHTAGAFCADRQHVPVMSVILTLVLRLQGINL
jgi:hypothetical protein